MVHRAQLGPDGTQMPDRVYPLYCISSIYHIYGVCALEKLDELNMQILNQRSSLSHGI